MCLSYLYLNPWLFLNIYLFLKYICSEILTLFSDGGPEGFGQLVGTGCVFETAADPLERGDDFLCAAAGHQTADALQISVAAAGEADRIDNVVAVYFQFDPAGAGASCSVYHITVLLMKVF